jgi:hypothetical protein
LEDIALLRSARRDSAIDCFPALTPVHRVR